MRLLRVLHFANSDVCKGVSLWEGIGLQKAKLHNSNLARLSAEGACRDLSGGPSVASSHRIIRIWIDYSDYKVMPDIPSVKSCRRCLRRGATEWRQSRSCEACRLQCQADQL